MRRLFTREAIERQVELEYSSTTTDREQMHREEKKHLRFVKFKIVNDVSDLNDLSDVNYPGDMNALKDLNNLCDLSKSSDVSEMTDMNLLNDLRCFWQASA